MTSSVARVVPSFKPLLCLAFSLLHTVPALAGAAAVPTPQLYARLPPIRGPIVATPGMVIEGRRISNPDGFCIHVPEGVQGVVIRHNDIGPCGPAQAEGGPERWGKDVGVYIQGSNVTVAHNTCHDVRSCVYAANGAKHPIVVERNLAWDIRGPEPRGQFVQFNRVKGGVGPSRITGNVSDKQLSSHPTGYVDHINLFGSEGTPESPILVACNKLRGGDDASGSGMIVGDMGGGWAVIRDNIFLMTANVGGVGCAGCHDTLIENNLVYARGATAQSKTNGGFYVMTDEGHRPYNVTFRGNRSLANGWLYGGKGDLSESFYDDKTVRGLVLERNAFKDHRLTADIWGHTPAACR